MSAVLKSKEGNLYVANNPLRLRGQITSWRAMSKDTLEFKRLHRTTDSGKQLTHDKIWPQRALLIIKHKWRREEKLQSVISHHFPPRKGEAGGGGPFTRQLRGKRWERCEKHNKEGEKKWDQDGGSSSARSWWKSAGYETLSPSSRGARVATAKSVWFKVTERPRRGRTHSTQTLW